MKSRQKSKRAKRRANVSFNAKLKGIDVLTSRTVIKKQLDHLVSLIVRQRDVKRFSGYCLICTVKRQLGFQSAMRPIQVGYHILPRGDSAVRWDLRNVIGTCAPCNQGELMSRANSSLKARYRALHAMLIGDAVMLELEALAETTVQYSTAELIDLRDKMKETLEDNPPCPI
jgi:hypothetical protein